MKKIILMIMATVLCTMPMVSHAGGAAAAGAKGGSAAAGSVTAGYVAAGAVGVAIVGGIALGSGGSGDGVSAEEQAADDLTSALSSLSADDAQTVKVALAELFTASDLTEEEAEAYVVVLQNMDNEAVTDVVDAISSAYDAGLTNAQVQEAMAEAGLKAKPTSAKGLAAYNALVAAFQAAAAEDATIQTAIKAIATGSSATKMKNIQAVVKVIVNSGATAAFVQVAHSMNIKDIISAVEYIAQEMEADGIYTPGAHASAIASAAHHKKTSAAQ